jgi:multicomponent Na+:H+ antiporter subunit B
MNSLLLRAAAKIIVPLQILLAIILLLRGHNEPGGGFIGGLVCGAAFILYGVAFGMARGQSLLPLHSRRLIGWGLLCSVLSGIPALLEGLPYMTGLWANFAIPTFIVGKLKFGTPLLFDFGVFLVVWGIATLMAFSMSDERGLH